jgi:thiamine-phosphate diphosphorylase
VELRSIRLVVITDGLTPLERVSPACLRAHAHGARFALLVRAYEAPIAAQVAYVKRARAAIPDDVPLFFAGHPREAIAAGASGVHLGRRSASIAEARAAFGADAWVSVPAHSAHDIADAEREGAYACLVSPVLGVPAKGPPLGFSGLRCLIEKARARQLRHFALGGLSPDDVQPCLRSGADGVAVIRSVWHAEAPEDAIVALARSVERASSH